MNKERQMNNAYRKKAFAKLIALGSLLAFIIILLLLRLSVDVSEWWSRTVARGYAAAADFLFGYLPFSLTEVLIVALAVGIIAWLVLLIRHLSRAGFRGSAHLFLNMGLTIAVIGSLYVVSAGMNYNRLPVDIPQYAEVLPEERTGEYAEAALAFQEDWNACADELSFGDDGAMIAPYDFRALNKTIRKEYERLTSPYFNQFSSNAKPMFLFSPLYLDLQISGVTFAPTGEPNINRKVPASELPFVVAHEMAHSKGVMRENEANLVAMYITLTSEDPWLRYSGYNYTYGALMDLSAASNIDGFQGDLIESFDMRIWKDQSYCRDYWKKHDVLGDLADKLNDLYLKLSGTDGVVSYQDIGQSSSSTDETGRTIVTIDKYSPYQALYMHFWLVERPGWIS